MSPKQSKTVLIVEPWCDGHHGVYLGWIAEALADTGARVIVALSEHARNHRALGPLQDRDDISLVIFDDPVPNSENAGGSAALIRREFTFWKLFGKWCRTIQKRHRIDLVFVPYLDYFLYAFGLLGSPFGDVQWVGIAMRPSFHYPKMGVEAPPAALAKAKELLFFRLLRSRTLKCLFSIDETLVEYVQGGRARTSRFRFLPEPVDLGAPVSRAEARAALGLREEGTMLLVYGALTARKGIPALLNAMEHPEFPSDVFVVFAGKISDDVMHRMREAAKVNAEAGNGRMVLIDRFISSAEETLLFSSADVIWLGYQGHFTSSGVLVQAAAAEKPVIACGEGLIGWRTKRYEAGVCVDICEPLAVCAALAALQVWQPPSPAAQSAQPSGHDLENFRADVSACLA